MKKYINIRAFPGLAALVLAVLLCASCAPAGRPLSGIGKGTGAESEIPAEQDPAKDPGTENPGSGEQSAESEIPAEQDTAKDQGTENPGSGEQSAEAEIPAEQDTAKDPGTENPGSEEQASEADSSKRKGDKPSGTQERPSPEMLRCGLPQAFDPSAVPLFAREAWADVNDDIPFFTDEEIEDAHRMTDALAGGSGELHGYQVYGRLDALGRCTGACALVGPETLPQEDRGNISSIKPTGWHSVEYDVIEGEYLYNRCHLIGFQLTGQNVNEENLITGTRFMNIEGMLPYEDSVLAYVRGTGKHVLYRVSPVFEGNNLLADGVLMEALSVEDPLVRFCAFCFNVQPGIYIDYATGESREYEDFPGRSGKADGSDQTGASGNSANSVSSERDDNSGKTNAGEARSANSVEEKDNSGSEGAGNTGKTNAEETRSANSGEEKVKSGSEGTGKDNTGDVNSKKQWDYIVNVNSGIFHRPDCDSVNKMREKNKQGFCGTREELIDAGYKPCGNCKP